MFNAFFVIIGTFIGAGFASGREIFTFFNIYGSFGFVGVIISNVILGFTIYKIFHIIIKYNISSYSEFIKKIIPLSPFFNKVFCNIINIFLLISFIVMVAGFSAYFSQEFGTSYVFGSIIICVLSFITFLKDINGIVKVNKFVIPSMVIIIVLLGIKLIQPTNYLNSLNIPYTNFWIVSTLLYASYNLISLVPILISLRCYISSLKQAKLVSILVSFLLGFISILLFLLMNLFYLEIQNVELPTIYIASKINVFYQYLCGFAILSAIFTTAISSGYSLLNNLNINKRSIYITINVLLCIVAVLLSNIGFSTLLNIFYPILGVLRLYSNNIYYLSKTP